MKVFIIIVGLGTLLASCGGHYNNTIVGKGVAQQCVMRPLDSLTADSAKKGWVAIDSSQAGNPSICATTVTLKKSVWQNWQDLINGGNRLVGAILGFIIAIIGVMVFVIRTSGGSNKTAEMLWVALAFVGVAILASSIYAFSDQIEVTKAQYDNWMAHDGDTHEAWELPAQTH